MTFRPLPVDLKLSDAPRLRFSLVRGGLLYRLERRIGLINDDHLGIKKRIFVFWCITWVPILVLELTRMAFAGTFAIPYPLLTSGLGINIRLLFSGAILIACESLVEFSIDTTLSQLERRGILADTQAFESILADAQNQISGATGSKAETMLLGLAFLSTILGMNSQYLGLYQDWKALAHGSSLPAGMIWYLSIALPLLTFLLLRWGWRFSAWIRILSATSKLPLRLNTSHPDMAGGLAFIALAHEAFALVWVALSSAASATVAFRTQVLGTPLQAFYLPIGSLIVIETIILLAPLTLFSPRLVAARRQGLLHYGALASDYVNDFDRKWIQGNRRKDEPLLGSPDIEQWGGVGVGLERSGKMRALPTSPFTVMVMIAAGALPFAPLLLQAVPGKQVLEAMLKLLI